MASPVFRDHDIGGMHDEASDLEIDIQRDPPREPRSVVGLEPTRSWLDD